MNQKDKQHGLLRSQLIIGANKLIQINQKIDSEIETQIIENNLYRILLSTFFLCILGVIHCLFFLFAKNNGTKEIIFLITSIMMILVNIVVHHISKKLLTQPVSQKRKRRFIFTFCVITLLFSISFSFLNPYHLKYLYIFLTYIGFVLIPMLNLKESFLLLCIPTALYTFITFYYQLPTRNFLELGLYFVIAIVISQNFYINEKSNLKKTKELILLNEELKTQAETDSLTGLYNRYGLKRIAQEKIIENCKKNHEFTVMMIDVDYFKHYNDTYGHPTGDTTLKDIAMILQKNASMCDVVARFGGEEFVIFSSNMNEIQAIELGQQLLKEVRNKKIRNGKGKDYPYVTISIGITTDTVKCHSDIMTLIEKADEQLYYAKEKGRNQLSIHHKLYR